MQLLYFNFFKENGIVTKEDGILEITSERRSIFDNKTLYSHTTIFNWILNSIKIN